MKWTDENGKTHQLTPITEPFVDPVGRRMLCWDGSCVVEQTVYAYLPTVTPGVITKNSRFLLCALVPEPKKRRMTNRELTKWLAQGNGEFLHPDSYVVAAWGYGRNVMNLPCSNSMKIRAWDETEWREPEVE